MADGRQYPLCDALIWEWHALKMPGAGQRFTWQVYLK